MATDSEVFDSIGDALNGMHIPTPFPVYGDLFVWDEEEPESGRFEFDAGVDTAIVDYQIKKFHADLLERFAQANVPAEVVDAIGYVVVRDGRWHVDDTQLLLQINDEPYLTPREWLDRKVQILTRNR